MSKPNNPYGSEVLRSDSAAVGHLISHKDEEGRTVPFLTACRFWLKLGFISFGGPTGQISVMHDELVEKKHWVSERRFLHALNYCMLLPGPEGQQLATYIGWLLHRTWGGLVAGTLFVLPSLLILLALSWVYMRFGDVPAVAGSFAGIKPAVTAIVVFAAYRIGSRVLKNGWLWSIAAMAFMAIFLFKVPFPAIVGGAAFIGYAGGRLFPEKFRSGATHQPEMKELRRAVIDDDTPPPAHAAFRWPRFSFYLLIGLALWLVPLSILGSLGGSQTTLSQMAWFFTKAALLTFGGAYAVLPYVYQGAVEHYGWLAPSQMIDGLALGESTPGPLIMIVTFVGFVGGWTKAIFGSDSLLLAGIAGGVVATYFTFLPSFLFILLGGPLVEATHGDVTFTAPLTGITAAVVGVILNLALFFAHHVLWPNGFDGSFEWSSAIIGVGALVALFKFRVPIVWLVGSCAAMGLAVHSFP